MWEIAAHSKTPVAVAARDAQHAAQLVRVGDSSLQQAGPGVREVQLLSSDSTNFWNEAPKSKNFSAALLEGRVVPVLPSTDDASCRQLAALMAKASIRDLLLLTMTEQLSTVPALPGVRVLQVSSQRELWACARLWAGGMSMQCPLRIAAQLARPL